MNAVLPLVSRIITVHYPSRLLTNFIANIIMEFATNAMYGVILNDSSYASNVRGKVLAVMIQTTIYNTNLARMIMATLAN
jgi:hypothetical protein